MSNHARKHKAYNYTSKPKELSEVSTEKARRDTTALLIGKLFHAGTGSHELMMETMMTLREDPERMEGVIGTLINLLYSYVTVSGQQEIRWKQLVDHLCDTLQVEVPS